MTCFEDRRGNQQARGKRGRGNGEDDGEGRREGERRGWAGEGDGGKVSNERMDDFKIPSLAFCDFLAD